MSTPRLTAIAGVHILAHGRPAPFAKRSKRQERTIGWPVLPRGGGRGRGGELLGSCNVRGERATTPPLPNPPPPGGRDLALPTLAFVLAVAVVAACAPAA